MYGSDRQVLESDVADYILDKIGVDRKSMTEIDKELKKLIETWLESRKDIMDRLNSVYYSATTFENVPSWLNRRITTKIPIYWDDLLNAIVKNVPALIEEAAKKTLDQSAATKYKTGVESVNNELQALRAKVSRQSTKNTGADAFFPQGSQTGRKHARVEEKNKFGKKESPPEKDARIDGPENAQLSGARHPREETRLTTRTSPSHKAPRLTGPAAIQVTGTVHRLDEKRIEDRESPPNKAPRRKGPGGKKGKKRRTASEGELIESVKRALGDADPTQVTAVGDTSEDMLLQVSSSRDMTGTVGVQPSVQSSGQEPVDRKAQFKSIGRRLTVEERVREETQRLKEERAAKVAEMKKKMESLDQLAINNNSISSMSSTSSTSSSAMQSAMKTYLQTPPLDRVLGFPPGPPLPPPPRVPSDVARETGTKEEKSPLIEMTELPPRNPGDGMTPVRLSFGDSKNPDPTPPKGYSNLSPTSSVTRSAQMTPVDSAGEEFDPEEFERELETPREEKKKKPRTGETPPLTPGIYITVDEKKKMTDAEELREHPMVVFNNLQKEFQQLSEEDQKGAKGRNIKMHMTAIKQTLDTARIIKQNIDIAKLDAAEEAKADKSIKSLRQLYEQDESVRKDPKKWLDQLEKEHPAIVRLVLLHTLPGSEASDNEDLDVVAQIATAALREVDDAEARVGRMFSDVGEHGFRRRLSREEQQVPTIIPRGVSIHNGTAARDHLPSFLAIVPAIIGGIAFAANPLAGGVLLGLEAAGETAEVVSGASAAARAATEVNAVKGALTPNSTAEVMSFIDQVRSRVKAGQTLNSAVRNAANAGRVPRPPPGGGGGGGPLAPGLPGQSALGPLAQRSVNGAVDYQPLAQYVVQNTTASALAQAVYRYARWRYSGSGKMKTFGGDLAPPTQPVGPDLTLPPGADPKDVYDALSRLAQQVGADNTMLTGQANADDIKRLVDDILKAGGTLEQIKNIIDGLGGGAAQPGGDPRRPADPQNPRDPDAPNDPGLPVDPVVDEGKEDKEEKDGKEGPPRKWRPQPVDAPYLKSSDPLLRLEFYEGGSNFVDSVNKDVKLRAIDWMQWSSFKNYQWEANEQPDNPLYTNNLAEEYTRFSDPMYGEDVFEEMEKQATFIVETKDKMGAPFRTDPIIQNQARDFFLDVVPLEGTAASRDRNMEMFKSPDATTQEFHDVQIPDWASISDTAQIEQFTAADGTQFPDSERIGGKEFSSYWWEGEEDRNQFIFQTLS